MAACHPASLHTSFPPGCQQCKICHPTRLFVVLPLAERVVMFKGILITKDEAGYNASVQDIDQAILGAGDVTVRVEWSTLNYKDALAITGKAPVAKRFPLVPGIDFAGIVSTSASPHWKAGDKVLLNGWGVGESHCGGLAQTARVQGDWLTALPGRFTTRQAMAVGTAGYTAMLCVMALQKHGIKPSDGEILVTGANGGVGSVTIALLSTMGYHVTASTGRLAESDYLRALGATTIVDRDELSAPAKPLARERWAGVVDSVGSHTLANACAASKYGGAVTACGLASGMDFPATVAPFILRGVTLYGIDSVMAPQALRNAAWQRLATELDMSKLEAITSEVELDQAVDKAHALLQGQVRGRVVVNIAGR